MHQKILALFTLVAALSMTSGCSTLADARAAKGTGPSRTYDATLDETWEAVPLVLKDLSLPLAGENRQQGYILAQRGLSFLSYGENVAIFIDGVAGAVKTRVEVISKKVMATNVFAPDWSSEILEKLGERLKASKLGTPTQASSPK